MFQTPSPFHARGSHQSHKLDYMDVGGLKADVIRMSEISPQSSMYSTFNNRPSEYRSTTHIGYFEKENDPIILDFGRRTSTLSKIRQKEIEDQLRHNSQISLLKKAMKISDTTKKSKKKKKRRNKISHYYSVAKTKNAKRPVPTVEVKLIKEKRKKRSGPPNPETFVRLYRDSFYREEMLKSKSLELRKKREALEIQPCTFKPSLISSNSTKRPMFSFKDRQEIWREKMRFKEEKSKAFKEEAELVGCTFEPSVNHSTEVSEGFFLRQEKWKRKVENNRKMIEDIVYADFDRNASTKSKKKSTYQTKDTSQQENIYYVKIDLQKIG